jgi:hypothetical protein
MGGEFSTNHQLQNPRALGPAHGSSSALCPRHTDTDLLALLTGPWSKVIKITFNPHK